VSSRKSICNVPALKQSHIKFAKFARSFWSMSWEKLMSHKYEIIIYWSEDDGLFIAEVPELAGCMAHGDAYESALASAHEAMQLWIDTAIERGKPVPEPKKRRLMFA
jgi:predicted RNase H-like HicB family nuclease